MDERWINKKLNWLFFSAFILIKQTKLRIIQNIAHKAKPTQMNVHLKYEKRINIAKKEHNSQTNRDDNISEQLNKISNRSSLTGSLSKQKGIHKSP